MAARPGKHNLDLYKGDSYEWEFRIWEDEGHTIEHDLTGTTPAAQVRDRPGGSIMMPMVCALTLPNIINMTLPAVNWASAPSLTNKSTAAWDLQVTYGDGSVVTMLAGTVNLTVDVTTP